MTERMRSARLFDVGHRDVHDRRFAQVVSPRRPRVGETIRRRDDNADLLARELNIYLAQQIDQAHEGLRKQMLILVLGDRSRSRGRRGR